MSALATQSVELQPQPLPNRRKRFFRGELPHLLRTPRKPRSPRIGLTQAEVAASLGVSQQTVAETEQRALRKCREWCRLHGLELSDLLPDENWREDSYEDEKHLQM